MNAGVIDEEKCGKSSLSALDFHSYTNFDDRRESISSRCFVFLSDIRKDTLDIE